MYKTILVLGSLRQKRQIERKREKERERERDRDRKNAHVCHM